MKFLTTLVIFIFSSILNAYSNEPEKNHQNSSETNLKNGSKVIAVKGMSSDAQLSKRIIDNLDKVTVPEPFIRMNLSGNELPPPPLKIQATNFISARAENRLQNWLNRNNAGQDILARWFDRRSNGTFDTKYLENSGLIKNEPVIAAINKEEFSAKEPADYFANSVVNETYLLVFNFDNVQTMTDYYNAHNTDKQERILRGYIADVETYIFKLDFNSAVARRFLDDFYTNSDDAAAQVKQENFDQAEFPFFFVAKLEDGIASVQPRANQKTAPANIKSNEELLDAMAQLAVENVANLVNKETITLSPAKTVTDTKPITAGIGNAQNVKFDQRYAVYQNRITATGNVKAKRVAVVKTMKVAANTNNKQGEEGYSAFYRIGGRKVNTNGMYLKKKYDTGINLFAGKTINGLSGNTGRFEYYFSKAMGGAVMPGNKAKGLTSVKLYFEAAQNKKSYAFSFSGQSENFTFTRGSIGIEKEYHPLAFMHWGPFVGYGLEYTTWENSEYLLSTNFVETGLRLGINLRHNVQIIGSATYYHLIKSVLMDENRYVSDPDFDYLSTFNDRTDWGYTIGLRIML